MTCVNISDLRSHLSDYLNRARRGEQILVRDRNHAIAKIVPLAEGQQSNELRALAARGLVRLPARKLNLKAWFALPAPKVSLRKLRAALEAEREDR